jgi:hypothetical protein
MIAPVRVSPESRRSSPRRENSVAVPPSDSASIPITLGPPALPLHESCENMTIRDLDALRKPDYRPPSFCASKPTAAEIDLTGYVSREVAPAPELTIRRQLSTMIAHRFFLRANLHFQTQVPRTPAIRSDLRPARTIRTRFTDSSKRALPGSHARRIISNATPGIRLAATSWTPGHCILQHHSRPGTTTPS